MFSSFARGFRAYTNISVGSSHDSDHQAHESALPLDLINGLESLRIEENFDIPGAFSPTQPEGMELSNDDTRPTPSVNLSEDSSIEALLTALTLAAPNTDRPPHHKLFSSSMEAYRHIPTTVRPLTSSDALESVQATLAAKAPVFSLSRSSGRRFGSNTPPVSPKPTKSVRHPAISSPQTPERRNKHLEELDGRNKELNRHESQVLDPAFSSLEEKEQSLRLESARHFLEENLGWVARESINAKRRDKSATQHGRVQSILSDTTEEQRGKFQERLRSISMKVYAIDALRPRKEPVVVDAGHAYRSDFFELDSINQVLIFLAVICNMIIGLSVIQANFILAVSVMLVKLGMSTDSSGNSGSSYSFTPCQNQIIADMPTSLADALKKFGAEGCFDMYATCPKCNFTNKAVTLDKNNHYHYPETCANQVVGEDGTSTCGTLLLRRHADGTLHPIKPYLVSSFHDYVAHCLSDPTYLELSNQAADKAYDAFRNGTMHSGTADVFDAEFTNDFKGPDGSLFVDRGDKTRLAFSIHTDFLNPNGLTHRGPTQSIGIISCANLALDPSIRYLPEYLYIASIIPGPKEPNYDEMDHFARPVIEQFAVAWRPGLKVSRTALSDSGSVVEAGIFLSINDLPAARKVAGFQGVSSDFICTVCPLRGRDRMLNTNHSMWGRRDVNELRRLAEQYRDAQTLGQRQSLFKEHGVRWSSFWLLEYWDPTRMLVIDAMHCVLEGLVHYHCRHVLRLDASALKNKIDSEDLQFAYDWPWVDYSDEAAPPGHVLKEKEVPRVAKLQNALCIALEGDKALTLDQLWTRLHNVGSRDVLHFVVHSLGLSLALNDISDTVATLYIQRICVKSKAKVLLTTFPYKTLAWTKSHFIAILIDWRLKQPFHSHHKLPVTGSPETLAHIRQVIQKTHTPSWVNSVPKNYGDLAAGTIKADEWRTLSTIYLPIALITYWGDKECPPSEDPQSLLEILNHTMALFQATMIVCRHTMTSSRARAYRTYLDTWMKGLHTIHPHTREHAPRPNIHAAQHIYDFLILFGPILNWWCFPFERLVGSLQKVNTNDRIGGILESTIMKTLAHTANIRCWLRRPECPEAVKQLKVLFDKCFVPANAVPAQENREMKGAQRAYAKHNGVNFSGVHTHSGNSHIIYRTKGCRSPKAGQIQFIENHSTAQGTEIRLHVKSFRPLPKALSDPFLHYPHLQATTYSSELCDKEDIIYLEDIVAHAARFDYAHGRSVFVNLSRD